MPYTAYGVGTCEVAGVPCMRYLEIYTAPRNKQGSRQIVPQPTKRRRGESLGRGRKNFVRVFPVSVSLAFRCLSDEPLGVREGDVRRGDAAAQVVADDRYSTVLPHRYATVSRAKIDTDRGTRASAWHGTLVRSY